MSPARPYIATPKLLQALSRNPALPAHTWYYIAATALSALNRPDEIPAVLSAALASTESPNSGFTSSNSSNYSNGVGAGVGAGRGNSNDSLAGSSASIPSRLSSHERCQPAAAALGDRQLFIARRMREALVKSAAVLGLPKTINALLALKSGTPSSLLDEPAEELPMPFSSSSLSSLSSSSSSFSSCSSTTSSSFSSSPSISSSSIQTSSPTSRRDELGMAASSTIMARGQAFFDRVYGKVSRRVMGQMERSGTEDLALVARLMYGHVLSNVRVLSPVETSWVLLAALIPQDVNPQLKGHLKGALNNGASVDEVRAVRDVVIQICEAGGMRRLGEGDIDGWGWRTDVAKL